MYLIEKNKILDLAKEIGKNHEMYGPVLEEKTGQVFFDKVSEINSIDLSAPIPSIPPKHVLFPNLENILTYTYDRERKDLKFDPKFENTNKALFGIRSCDLTGILCLDRFYLGQEFVDDVYRNHRKKMFIVSNTCVKPFKSCFCACTDSGPCASEGYDLNLTDLGSVYLVEAGSEKGKALAESLKLKKSDDSHLREKKAAVDKSLSLFDDIAKDSKAWVSRVMNRVTTGFISDETWQYVGDQCLECGACSFVCPTCSCFNINDVNCGSSSDRIRTWDSCSYEGYSRMAGGHNPRKPVEDRRNKRFFCKLSYSQSKKYLRPGCVGCGRCAWVCPGNIGLPNVVTYIRREIQSDAERKTK